MTTLTNIAANASGNEVIANQNFAAVAPAGLFGIKSNVGLTLILFGGVMRSTGALLTIADWTGTMSNAATNYVEVDSAGAVSSNTTAFTTGRMKLYTVVTAGSVMTSITDWRVCLTWAPL